MTYKRGYSIMFIELLEYKVLKRKAKILLIIYNWLEYLIRQSYIFSAFNIIEAVLFL
jgi:hypothetical protein